MNDVIEIERGSFENLLNLLQAIRTQAGTVYWEIDCGEYLEKLEFEITRLRWDSMLAAHVIDNRNGVTGLKFQTYVNFGVVDYDSAISSYLEGVTKSANSLNKVDQLIERFGPEMLMTYCGLDTIYGLKLTLKQREELQLARGEK